MLGSRLQGFTAAMKPVYISSSGQMKQIPALVSVAVTQVQNSAFPPKLLLLSARWPQLRLGTGRFWKEREGNLTDRPAEMERLRLKKV